MRRVLVVDDDDQVRLMLQLALERDGYEVELAADGGQAVALQHSNPVDLVITDLVMPEKEGIETIVELLRDFPDLKIIAISGGGMLGSKMYLDMAHRLGAARTFPKPVERNELLEAVSQLIDEGQPCGQSPISLGTAGGSYG